MSNKVRIIAVSGKAQHGKDTFASVLHEQLVSDGYKVLVTHYADLLKYICKTFFNWDGQKDEAGRHILQYVGTDIVRKVRPDFWVEFILDIVDLFGDNWDYVIIPDTRFPNEIDMLKSRYKDTLHIRVVRPDFESNLTLEQKNHPSETALDNVEPDYVVRNSGSIDDLRQEVKGWDWL